MLTRLYLNVLCLDVSVAERSIHEGGRLRHCGVPSSVDTEPGLAKNPSEASEGKTVPGSSAGGCSVPVLCAVGWSRGISVNHTQCISSGGSRGAQSGSSHPLVVRPLVTVWVVAEGGHVLVVLHPGRQQR